MLTEAVLTCACTHDLCLREKIRKMSHLFIYILLDVRLENYLKKYSLIDKTQDWFYKTLQDV